MMKERKKKRNDCSPFSHLIKLLKERLVIINKLLEIYTCIYIYLLIN